jgi:glutaminyl-peptide cyclotransferase
MARDRVLISSMHNVRRRGLVVWAAAAIALVAGCSSGQPSADPGTSTSKGPVPVVTPVVLSEMPHDTSAWIEGLEFDGPTLYEGTGVAGQSQLRELDPETGAVRRAAAVPNNYYGEGITVVGDRIWELTWQNGVAVEWDKNSLTPIREVPVNGEGWGLCNDGARVIRSDGTDRLRFHHPTTFAETGSIGVTRDGKPVTNINELDCVDGQVWANVWMSDTIVRIDPATGEVNAVVDAGQLAGQAGRDRQKVLNGIAHIDGDEFLITGKYWPKMYRVRIDVPSN